MTDTTFAHDAPAGGAYTIPEPLLEVPEARRRTAAEEARTLVEGTTVGALGTLTADGDPWTSLVTYGVLPGGSPVICVSTLAEHGRNLVSTPRASLMVATEGAQDDPLANARVTLVCRAERPEGPEAEQAAAAHRAAHPQASVYAGFGDFSLWVLRVERVRWVGGYGRMDSADAAAYAGAEPDPVAPHAAFAVGHLNDDHADALLVMAQHLGGYPDATSARVASADRYGVDLQVRTPRGPAATRIGFAVPADEPDGLRPGTVELAKRARRLAAAAS